MLFVTESVQRTDEDRHVLERWQQIRAQSQQQQQQQQQRNVDNPLLMCETLSDTTTSSPGAHATTTTATSTAVDDSSALELSSAESRLLDECTAHNDMIWNPSISLSSGDIANSLQASYRRIPAAKAKAAMPTRTDLKRNLGLRTALKSASLSTLLAHRRSCIQDYDNLYDYDERYSNDSAHDVCVRLRQRPLNSRRASVTDQLRALSIDTSETATTCADAANTTTTSTTTPSTTSTTTTSSTSTTGTTTTDGDSSVMCTRSIRLPSADIASSLQPPDDTTQPTTTTTSTTTTATTSTTTSNGTTGTTKTGGDSSVMCTRSIRQASADIASSLQPPDDSTQPTTTTTSTTTLSTTSTTTSSTSSTTGTTKTGGDSRVMCTRSIRLPSTHIASSLQPSDDSSQPTTTTTSTTTLSTTSTTTSNTSSTTGTTKTGDDSRVMCTPSIRLPSADIAISLKPSDDSSQSTTTAAAAAAVGLHCCAGYGVDDVTLSSHLKYVTSLTITPMRW